MVTHFLLDLLQKLRSFCLSIDSRYASFSDLKSPALVAFPMLTKFQSPNFAALLLSYFVVSLFLDLTSLKQLFRDCLQYCILESLPYASILCD